MEMEIKIKMEMEMEMEMEMGKPIIVLVKLKSVKRKARILQILKKKNTDESNKDGLMTKFEHYIRMKNCYPY